MGRGSQVFRRDTGSREKIIKDQERKNRFIQLRKIRDKRFIGKLDSKNYDRDTIRAVFDKKLSNPDNSSLLQSSPNIPSRRKQIMSILETNINYELTKVLSKVHHHSQVRQTTSNVPKPNQSKPDPTKTISNGINLAKSVVTRQKSVHPTLDGQPAKGHQCVGSLAKGKN